LIYAALSFFFIATFEEGSMSKSLTVAVAGATGAVGRELLATLEARNFPAAQIIPLASARSAGSTLPFKGGTLTVQELTPESFKGVDLALFSAGGDISKSFAPLAVKSGCVVVDNSSAWRMDDRCPLVVPEVNPHALKKHKGIISNPNCSTIQAVVALKPLQDRYGLKRVIYSTYQAVAGAGTPGVRDLEEGLKGNPPQKFPHPIAGNVLPHIDSFRDNGYTGEEMKMMEETRKILGLPDLPVTATTVRVPVFYGHSISVNAELLSPFDLDGLIGHMGKAPGIVLQNNWAGSEYPMPVHAAGKDEVFVGRIRRDESVENGINMWVVADSVRKGAATNAVQIAEYIIAHCMQ